MKKLRNKTGFTLIEMLAVVLIIVILVIGMGTTMNAGSHIYAEAVFEADSASMAGILNTALGDILRYSSDVKINKGTAADPTAGFKDSSGSYIINSEVAFVFTSVEYGIRDAYFHIDYTGTGDSMGVLQMKNLKNSSIVELVNTGAYPDLMVKNFEITYVEPSAALHGGYFDISYDVVSKSNEDLTRDVSTVVRLLNAED